MGSSCHEKEGDKRLTRRSRRDRKGLRERRCLDNQNEESIESSLREGVE